MMSISVILAFLLLLFNDFLSITNCEEETICNECRLTQKLIGNYSKIGIYARPVKNDSDIIIVKFGMSLIRILDFDERTQTLTTVVYLRQLWRDMNMQWDPTEFSGIDTTRVPMSKIWSPDIVMYYNSFELENMIQRKEGTVVVYNTGEVLWVPPAILKSICPFDPRYFPFDTQICHFKFGSWVYDGFKIDLDYYEGQKSIDISDYINNNEWILQDTSAWKYVKYYTCCSEPYPDLTFSLVVKRNSSTYTWMFVAPSILLSILTLVILWLPASTHRILFSMILFFGFYVLFVLMENILPNSASIPILGINYFANMILITISVLVSAFILQIQGQTGERTVKVPNLLKKITIDIIAPICCMIPRTKKFSESKHGNPAPSIQVTDGKELSKSSTEDGKLDASDVKEIHHLLKSYIGRLEDKEEDAKNSGDWKLVARVLDRIFFLLFLIVELILLLAFNL